MNMLLFSWVVDYLELPLSFNDSIIDGIRVDLIGISFGFGVTDCECVCGGGRFLGMFSAQLLVEERKYLAMIDSIPRASKHSIWS